MEGAHKAVEPVPDMRVPPSSPLDDTSGTTVPTELPAPPDEANSPPSTAFVSKCKNITLKLTKKATSSSWLEVELELKNEGKARASLMATGDGSCANMRNPTMTFDLDPNQRGPEERCGMINALAEEDFLALKPGESKKLEWISAPTPAKNGHYTLRATYRNDPDANPLRGGAPAAPKALLDRVKATVPCEVTSNAITFDWKVPPARKCSPNDPLCAP
jgi:hypothetical protein